MPVSQALEALVEVRPEIDRVFVFADLDSKFYKLVACSPVHTFGLYESACNEVALKHYFCPLDSLMSKLLYNIFALYIVDEFADVDDKGVLKHGRHLTNPVDKRVCGPLASKGDESRLVLGSKKDHSMPHVSL